MLSTTSSPLEYASAILRSKGISISTGMSSSAAYPLTLSSPMSARFIIIPQGMPSIFTAPAASFRSLSPKGVGSVTRIIKSVFFIADITGHDVPGGASIIVRPLSSAIFLTLLIRGGDMASPTLNLPWIKITPFLLPFSMTPSSRPVSVMAPSGQTSMHPPQL